MAVTGKIHSFQQLGAAKYILDKTEVCSQEFEWLLLAIDKLKLAKQALLSFP